MSTSSFSVKRDSPGHYIATAVMLTVSFVMFCTASLRTFNPLVPAQYGICSEFKITQLSTIAALTCLFSFICALFSWLSLWGYSCNMTTMHCLHWNSALWIVFALGGVASSAVMLFIMGDMIGTTKNVETQIDTPVSGCGLPGAVPDLLIMYGIGCFFTFASVIHRGIVGCVEQRGKDVKKVVDGF